MIGKMLAIFLKLGRFVTVIMAVFVLVKFFTGNVYTFKTESGKVVGGAENFTDFYNFTRFGANSTAFFGNATNITGCCFSTDNITDLWPEFIQIRMWSFFRKIPDPNFDAADEVLIAAWKLPPKTQLSPVMRQIARCVLAAEKKTDFDVKKCFVVDRWWPIWIVVMLGFFAAYNSFRLIFGLCFKLENVNCDDMYFLPYWAWSVAYLLLAFFRAQWIDLGFWYTLYGEFDPKPYYFLCTQDLVLVSDLLMYGFYFSTIEYLFYDLCSFYESWKKFKAIESLDGKIKPIKAAKPKKLSAVV